MNNQKLTEAMSACGVSIAAMCSQLGLSRSAFYRKTRGISEFTRSEIQAIVDILQLDSPMEIFFSKLVS